MEPLFKGWILTVLFTIRRIVVIRSKRADGKTSNILEEVKVDIIDDVIIEEKVIQETNIVTKEVENIESMGLDSLDGLDVNNLEEKELIIKTDLENSSNITSVDPLENSSFNNKCLNLLHINYKQPNKKCYFIYL